MCRLSKHLKIHIYGCTHHKIHTLEWSALIRDFPWAGWLYFYSELWVSREGGMFQRYLFPDRHNRPWRCNWCREGIRLFWTAREDRRTGHECLRRLWLGRSPSLHCFLIWGYLLQGRTPFWLGFPVSFLPSWDMRWSRRVTFCVTFINR